MLPALLCLVDNIIIIRITTSRKLCAHSQTLSMNAPWASLKSHLFEVVACSDLKGF